MDIENQAQRIITEAMRIQDQSERARFIEVECGSNAVLKEYVNRRIEEHEGVSGMSFLKPPGTPLRIDVEIMPEVEDYEVVEPIGAGGMGTVYRARQLEPIRREVALKVGKNGIGNETRQRFDAEVHNLAAMDHANIAKVFDSGKTASGMPFFTMEYIDGIPITDYADNRKLSVAERLSLFLQVCDAVSHAHKKTLLHRDIKPANVLVADREGKPFVKVIDFSLSKLLCHSSGDAVPLTPSDAVLGTPEYMSPEQTWKPTVDTTSDIYSMGILLYELLMGTVPYRDDFRDADDIDSIREIRDRQVLKPSDALIRLRDDGVDRWRLLRTTLKKLKRQLQEDLDWIVMKALDSNPAKRFESVPQFKDEIANFLDGRCITSRPPNWQYQFGKWVRRHRSLAASVAVIVLLLLMLLPSVVGLSIMKNDLEESNRVVRRQRDEILRFSDRVEIEGLLESAKALPPTSTDNAKELASWLADARAVTKRAEFHRKFLANLRSGMSPLDIAQHPLYPMLEKCLVGKQDMLKALDMIRDHIEPVATQLGFGRDPKWKPATYYFRHEFNVDSDTDVNSLSCQVTFDDGFVLYLNGRELMRKNLPQGRIAYDSLAIQSVNNDIVSEKFDVEGIPILPGRNMLAVELHQVDRSDHDTLFDLKLIALSDGLAPFSFIEPQSEWNYNDQGIDPGERWTELDYDDARWSEGEAPFGYNAVTSLENRLANQEGTIQKLTTHITETPIWRFEDEQKQWKHDTSQLVLNDLEKLEEMIAIVEKRHSFALTVRERTVDCQFGTLAWKEAIKSIMNKGRCPQYDGLVIEPIEGLLPIGQDPLSGLWEFAHLETGSPPPRNDETRRLELSESTGLVFVLIPGGDLLFGAEHPLGLVEHVDDVLRIKNVPIHSYARGIGLQVGDIVTGFNGKTVRNIADVDEIFSTLDLGQQFELIVHRFGESVTLQGTVRPNLDCLAEARESPISPVKVLPFLLSKYEMTQGQWINVELSNPSRYPAGFRFEHAKTPVTLSHPVENVDWQECSRVMRSMGLKLPSEVQLEYAVRALTPTRWWTGNQPSSLSGMENCSADATDARFCFITPVGTFAANPFGLFDASGNVFEWCSSRFILNLTPEATRNAAATDTTPTWSRAAKGGSCSRLPQDCRTTARWPVSSKGTGEIGLRPMMDLPGQQD